MPRLSVIVPIYNTEKYLRDCINSILNQSFVDFELVLIDDGSTDKSGDICDEYALSDCRIRVVHQKNLGVTRARKIGATLARGDYVTYVDSDDWIDSDTYNYMMFNIEKHNSDIGIFAMVLEKNTPTVMKNCVEEGIYSKDMLKKTVYPNMLFDYSLNRSGVIASLCNKVTKREILQKAIASIPEDLRYGEDNITGYLCMLNASTIFLCNNPFYHYRNNPSSISHADSSIMKKWILALDREMRYCLSGYDTDMSRQINGHIARKTVEIVRCDLLYLENIPFQQRCCIIREFCENPQIMTALVKAYPEIRDKKEKIKVLFIRYKLFALLYFLFKKV